MNFEDIVKKNSIKGTRTEENLQKALQGESLAHMKYQFYKSQIGKLSKNYENELDEIIHNEKEHAKIWFKLLHNGVIPSNIENLQDAEFGEGYEAQEMYPEFARVAREEGFDEIAELFEEVGLIESYHCLKFHEMLFVVKNQSVFNGHEETIWKCLNCGHLYMGANAPETCPVCDHPQKYFVEDES